MLLHGFFLGGSTACQELALACYFWGVATETA